jgi:hypothetical protein
MSDDRPNPRTIPVPLTVLMAVGALVVGVILGRAWGGSGDVTPSISPSPPSGATETAAAGPGEGTPTATPAGNGSVSRGQASLSLSGGVNSVVELGRLATPADWAPPPGTIALSWTGSGQQVLSLGGPSFTSQIATDAEHTLSFTVEVDGAPVSYVSAAGECTVTISPALPTQMGGTFFCTNLPSTDGEPIVNVQGSFAATE